MTLSSRRGVRCGGLVWPVVAEHRPQDVEASAGQGQDGLDVGFAFGAFAVVVGARLAEDVDALDLVLACAGLLAQHQSDHDAAWANRVPVSGPTHY